MRTIREVYVHLCASMDVDGGVLCDSCGLQVVQLAIKVLMDRSNVNESSI